MANVAMTEWDWSVVIGPISVLFLLGFAIAEKALQIRLFQLWQMQVSVLKNYDASIAPLRISVNGSLYNSKTKRLDGG